MFTYWGRSWRVALCVLLGCLVLFAGHASAANCPYCGRKYPEPAPWKGEKERVQALRETHERECKAGVKDTQPKVTPKPKEKANPPAKGLDPRFLDAQKERARDMDAFLRGADIQVLRAARSYADGGGFIKPPRGKLHGVPEDVVLGGGDTDPIRKADLTKGTYCCGFTFAVAMKAARSKGLLTGKPRPAVERFATEWYGANATSAEKQCVLAMENLRVGEEVQPDVKDIRQKKLLPGDFVMFWRGPKSGHSVVFLDWVRDGKGGIVGMKYRSSQDGTKGIGDAVEYFRGAPGGGGIDPLRTYAGRLYR